METASVHRDTNTADYYHHYHPISIPIHIRSLSSFRTDLYLPHSEPFHIHIPNPLPPAALRGTVPRPWPKGQSGVTTKVTFIRQSGSTATNRNSPRCSDCVRSGTQNSSSGWNCKIVGAIPFTNSTVSLSFFLSPFFSFSWRDINVSFAP